MISSSSFIKLLIVVVLVVLDVFKNIQPHRGPPVSACSPDNPELSVVIDCPQELSDGGVKQGSDGEVYPPGTWWESGEEVRGCPCSRGKPCIRKCCPVGESFSYQDGLHCVKNMQLKFIESLTIIREKHFPVGFEKINMTAEDFDILPKNCEGSVRNSDDLLLMQDGTLLSTSTRLTVVQSEFCLDISKELGSQIYIICGEMDLDKQKAVINASMVYIPMVSASIITFTLGVYSLVPRLRRGCGKAIMCYLVSELLRKIVYTLRMAHDSKTVCIISAQILVYFVLSAQAWLVVISYMLWAMTGASGGVAGRLESRNVFLLHCALAWGVPLAILALGEVADRAPGLPDILKPGLSHGECTFPNSYGKITYYILPQLLANLANLAFCVATLARLARGRRNSKTLQNNGSRRYNASEIQWTNLFMKVVLLMGVNHIINLSVNWMSYLVFPHVTVRHIAIDFLLAKGVEVFLIFVCQKDILREFFHRLAFWEK